MKKREGSILLSFRYNPVDPAAVKRGVDQMTVKAKRSRYISSAVRKQVWARAQGKYQYPNCQSSYLLEVEHLVPFAKGGSHDLDNLALYCRTHNVLSQANEFGKRISQVGV